MFVVPGDDQIDTDTDANRTICHIKGRPVVAMECEIEEIHHMPIVEPVHHIANNAAGDHPEGDLIAQPMDLERPMEDGNHDERDHRDGGENQI